MIAEEQKIDTDFSLEIVKDGEKQATRFDEMLVRPAVVPVYMLS